MRKWLFIIFTVIILIPLHSCVTVDFINLDIRKPAHTTFEPGTNKIVIVDNSFKPKAIPDSSGIIPAPIALRDFLVDSIRPALLRNITLFMNSEKLFDTIQLYPYYPRPLYEYYKNDSIYELPLTKEDVQNICYKTDADALISLDFIDINISKINKQLFLTESACIFRSYSASGDPLASPLINRDTITVLEENSSISKLSKFLIYENPIYLANRLVDSFIPKWETQERVLFRNFPDNTSKALQFMSEGMWKEAFQIWEEAFNKTNNTKKKVRYASNLTLVCEFMDDVELAQECINKANDLLSTKDKSDLAKYIRYYKGIIDERVKNAPILTKQLNLDFEEDL